MKKLLLGTLAVMFVVGPVFGVQYVVSTAVSKYLLKTDPYLVEVEADVPIWAAFAGSLTIPVRVVTKTNESIILHVTTFGNCTFAECRMQVELTPALFTLGILQRQSN
jgi:hypothetical protein